MKHLWLILFVIPLFGQSPCDDEKYLEMKRKKFDMEDLDYYISLHKKCRQFKIDELKKEKAEIKKTLSERKNPCDEEERNKLDKGSQERKKFDENCRKYIREKNLKFADENINKLKSSGSYNKGAYKSNRNNSSISNSQLNELLNVIDSELENYINESSRSSSPTLSYSNEPKGCQVYGKIKFVEYGEDYKVKFVSYGENLKVKYVDFGESQAGNWKVVEFGERYKIKVVEYGEDFTVKTVSYGQGCN
jgi:hypothetical protein